MLERSFEPTQTLATPYPDVSSRRESALTGLPPVLGSLLPQMDPEELQKPTIFGWSRLAMDRTESSRR